MFCRKCGKEMPDDSVFCPKCGMSVAVENNDENQQTEPINLNQTEENAQNPTQSQDTGIQSIEEYYSDQAYEERRLKAEAAIKSESKSKRVRTVLGGSIIGICVVVSLILYFSLRQFGYTHKDDGWYISRYYGSNTNVTIPTTHFGQAVVGIAKNAFEGSTIESVVFSSKTNNGKFKIEERAFYNCRYLETVSFERWVTEAKISANAFENCTSLDTVAFCGKRFNLLSLMKEAQRGGSNKDINYAALSAEEAKKAKQEAASKIIEASSLSKFRFDKSAFTGCTKFNDVQ